MRLKDKVAIVTGSARGLGKGIAKKLAEEGARVVIADMAGAEETAAEINAEGGTASAFQVNVAKQDEVAALVQFAIDTYGTLDIMVNNAGINRDGMLHKMPVENWDTVIAVDLTGTFYGTQEALKYMRGNAMAASSTFPPEAGLAISDRPTTQQRKPASSALQRQPHGRAHARESPATLSARDSSRQT